MVKTKAQNLEAMIDQVEQKILFKEAEKDLANRKLLLLTGKEPDYDARSAAYNEALYNINKEIKGNETMLEKVKQMLEAETKNAISPNTNRARV